jgi:hypothetical protein
MLLQLPLIIEGNGLVRGDERHHRDTTTDPRLIFPPDEATNNFPTTQRSSWARVWGPDDTKYAMGFQRPNTLSVWQTHVTLNIPRCDSDGGVRRTKVFWGGGGFIFPWTKQEPIRSSPKAPAISAKVVASSASFGGDGNPPSGAQPAVTAQPRGAGEWAPAASITRAHYYFTRRYDIVDSRSTKIRVIVKMIWFSKVLYD